MIQSGDLENTIWVFNEELALTESQESHNDGAAGNIKMRFKSNDQEYLYIYVTKTSLWQDHTKLEYDSTVVYTNGKWVDDAYRVIIFSDSGYDYVSNSFLEFLELNAVQALPQNFSNDEAWCGLINVSKQNGTKVFIDTNKKYLEKDIELTLNVQAGSASTPDTTITANPAITMSDTGLITATAYANQLITPSISTGFISTGTAGTISIRGSNTYQIPIATLEETKAYLGIA